LADAFTSRRTVVIGATQLEDAQGHRPDELLRRAGSNPAIM